MHVTQKDSQYQGKPTGVSHQFHSEERHQSSQPRFAHVSSAQGLSSRQSTQAPLFVPYQETAGYNPSQGGFAVGTTGRAQFGATSGLQQQQSLELGWSVGNRDRGERPLLSIGDFVSVDASGQQGVQSHSGHGRAMSPVSLIDLDPVPVTVVAGNAKGRCSRGESFRFD